MRRSCGPDESNLVCIDHTSGNQTSSNAVWRCNAIEACRLRHLRGTRRTQLRKDASLTPQPFRCHFRSSELSVITGSSLLRAPVTNSRYSHAMLPPSVQMQRDERTPLLRPGDQHWEKCARHQNASTTRFVANMFLCDDCSDRLQHEAFNGRPPLFEGLHVEGYCGLCNELTATDLRQWFVCPICLNVVLSYPKGFAASRNESRRRSRTRLPGWPPARRWRRALVLH